MRHGRISVDGRVSRPLHGALALAPAHDGPDTRGHGIPFMHALMDQVNIQTTEHGTTVTMTKEL